MTLFLQFSDLSSYFDRFMSENIQTQYFCKKA